MTGPALAAGVVVLTGATGFLGREVAARLTGRAVRALTRRPAPELAALGVDVRVGDLEDPRYLADALSGCASIVHMAGLVDMTGAQAEAMRRVHVEATRALCDAALAAGVARFVLVSSSGTTIPNRHGRPVAEDAPYPMELVARWPYYLTKTMQEKLVRSYAGRGLPVVIVGPGLLLGPGDPSGRSIELVDDVLQGRIPVIPPGGLTIVDVRDCADAVVAALARGRVGERYFVTTYNGSFADFFLLMQAVAGTRPPWLTLPRPLYLGASRLMARLVPRHAPDPERSDVASYFWYADASKAREELGFRPRPIEATLRDTVAYLRGQRERSEAVPGHAS